jgi:hypothetical protein
MTLSFAAGQVAAQNLQCPETIDVRQQLTMSVPGWTSIEDSVPHRLASISFYDGHPEDRVTLVPNTSKKSSERETSIWLFKEPADRRIWVACRYGGATITLVKELPAGTHVCSVVYNLRQRIEGLPIIERISCDR